MTEDNSFGAVATEPKPAAPVEEAAARNNRPLFIVGGVAVVVLAVFAYLLFGGGGGTDEATGAVPKPVAPNPAASAPADPAASPAASTPPSTDVKGRNPFTPLEVEVPVDDNAGTTTDTGNGTTTDTTTTDTSTTTPPPTTPTTPAAATVTVKLVSVKGDVVATKVGNVNYTGLGAGDTFGTSFQVYAIFNESCAGLLYGDQSFALCEGGSTTLTKL